jgi:ammonia channel protein AmtB
LVKALLIGPLYHGTPFDCGATVLVVLAPFLWAIALNQVVHGVAIDVVLTVVLVDAALGGAGLAEGRSVSGQLAIQLTRIAATLLWSVVVRFAIAKVVEAVTGLCVNAEVEEQGLDLRLRGERGYNM